MKNDLTSKLSASFMALAVVLSALVFIPVVGQAQTTGTANIYVPVLSDGSPVEGATVNLIDVHTGSVIAAGYDWERTSYVVLNAPAGHYRVDVTHDDYYDQLEWSVFRFNGTKNHTVNPVSLEAFDAKQWQWNVSVKRPDGFKAVGATVGFYDRILNEFVEKGITDQANGSVVLEMFTTPSIDLVVVFKGFQTYISTVAVNSDNSLTVTLAASSKVTSYLTDSSGSPAPNVVAYLVNTDNSIPWVKRVLRSTGSAMSFDAYPGSFVLVVDAYGCAAHVQAVTVPGLLPPASIELSDQTKRTENVMIGYGADFTGFSLSVNTTWSYDDAYPGLRYNDMGSLRMQIDLVRGDGDGVLETSEVNDFIAEVQSYGSQYVSSASLLKLNETAYLSANLTTGFVLDLVPGSVVDTTGVDYAYNCVYAADTIDVGAHDYDALLYARPDTPAIDYKYRIVLPAGYERVGDPSSSKVNVTGYATVDIDRISGSSLEVVGLDFEKSDLPLPKAEVKSDPETGSIYWDVVEDDEGNFTGYVVRVGWNATFSAEGSVDPNGNPLTYTWDFGDGAGTFTTENDTYVYNYSTASVLRVVTLTVKDAAELTNSTTINVTCDGLAPKPVIAVKNKTLNETDNSITVEQRESIVFNATYSKDDVAVVGDEEGTIAFFEFEYGDGNKSSRVPWEQADKNVTHSYASSGTYTVVLNVTDVVGQWKNTTMLVKVNDTQAPSVSYVIKNETWGSSLIENKTVIFDATATTDNLDNITLLHFSWNLGDGTWMNGTGADGYSNVTHNYSRIGQIQVVLNVTDTTGNYLPSAKVITIAQGLRPNLRINNATYDPKPLTEDKAGLLRINMTNTGSAVATGVVVYIYSVEADGSLKLLGQTSEFVNTTTGLAVTSVEVGGTVWVEYSITFKSKGTYTLRINVSSTNQLRENTLVMSGDTAVQVEEAGWKQFALWGGVLAVIVLVPLALLLMRRRSGRERGPRREKKSKAEEGK
ncbi:MAG: PKD domain-containing protein [Candidatus Thermoplasmatota archaeon]|nr:PKD domain-containing protein [Candidatus Thermoplasmatota archaeon]